MSIIIINPISALKLHPFYQFDPGLLLDYKIIVYLLINFEGDYLIPLSALMLYLAFH